MYKFIAAEIPNGISRAFVNFGQCGKFFVDKSATKLYIKRCVQYDEEVNFNIIFFTTYRNRTTSQML